MFFVRVFDLYKEYNSCLISFSRFSELVLVFNWAKEIGSLLSILLGVNIFSPTPFCFLLLTADFSLSKLGIPVVSGCSSVFWFNSSQVYSFCLTVFRFWFFFLSCSKDICACVFLGCLSSVLFFNFIVSYLPSTILMS